MPKIIAVDGPSGVGKSSICKAVANRLSYNYVDTGAIYRSIALIIYRNFINSEVPENTQLAGILEEQKDKILTYIKQAKFRMSFDKGVLSVMVNDEDFSLAIRDEKISFISSYISKYEYIRASLLDLQRELAIKTDKLASIIDGRDIGTVVFPDADIKIFLTASLNERAKRRYKELMERGDNLSFSQVVEKIKQRDYNDIHRKIAPLKQADDAVVLDTDGLSFNEVVEKFISYIT